MTPLPPALCGVYAVLRTTSPADLGVQSSGLSQLDELRIGYWHASVRGQRTEA